MSSAVRSAVEVAAWWALLFLLYTVFISTPGTLELAIGAGASGLAAWGGWALHRAARPPAGPAGQLAAALWAWPAALLAETAGLARLTARALSGRSDPGRFRSLRLRAGVGPAWASLLLSGTPGSCVTAVDESTDRPGATLRVHALLPAGSRLERALTEPDDA